LIGKGRTSALQSWGRDIEEGAQAPISTLGPGRGKKKKKKKKKKKTKITLDGGAVGRRARSV